MRADATQRATAAAELSLIATFLVLVRGMRRAQKSSTRGQGSVSRSTCSEFERLVDAELDRNFTLWRERCLSTAASIIQSGNEN